MKQTDKKILFLTRLYHPHIGGVEKHVNKLTRELLLKKKQVTIVTELNDTQLKRKEQFQNHTIYRIPIGNQNFLKKFYIWYWFFKNISLIRKADIIHVHDVFYWILPFRFLFPFKKIYITFHGYEDYPIKKSWIIQRKIFESISSGSICIGSFMKRWYKASPSVILYGGVDIPRRQSKKPTLPTALFFGRLENQTNAYEYVLSGTKIKKILPKFSLAVVGDGPILEKIKSLADISPLDPNIEKKITSYRYIFVSRYLSILEALAQKRLVFAYYDNPIKKDYLLNSPLGEFVVPVNSVNKLTQKFLYYYNHPKEEEKMISKGYEWVRKNSWKNVAEAYLKLWQLP